MDETLRAEAGVIVKLWGIAVLTLYRRGCRLFERGDLESLGASPLPSLRARRAGDAETEEAIVNDSFCLPLNHQDVNGSDGRGSASQAGKNLFFLECCTAEGSAG